MAIRVLGAGRYRGVCAFLAVMILASGCGRAASNGCSDVPQEQIDRIMNAAQVGFVTSGGVEVDHLEFRAAGQRHLPARLQDFGITKAVVVNVWAFYANPVSDELGASGVSFLFGSNDDGSVIYSLDAETANAFELDTPDDPDWSAWHKRNVSEPIPLKPGEDPGLPRNYTSGDPAINSAFECVPSV